MAYFNGPITSNAALLEQIVTMMIAEGWGVLFDGDGEAASNGDNGLTAAHVPRAVVLDGPDGVPVTLFITAADTPANNTDGANLRGIIYNEYDPGVSVFSQFTNSSRPNDLIASAAISTTNRNQFAGGGTTEPPTEAWIFTSPTYCHAVWSTEPGVFWHFHVGQIDKGYDFFGGLYVGGTMCPPGFARTDEDSNLNRRPFMMTNDVGSITRLYFYHGDYDGQVARTAKAQNSGSFDTHRVHFNCFGRAAEQHNYIPPPYTGRAVLLPLNVMIANQGTDRGFIQGTVSDARVTSIQNLNPGEIVTFQGDQWQVFPFCRKAPNGVDFGTRDQAMAYRINP